MSTNSTSASVFAPACFMPGTERINGAFTSFSTLLCLHHASCSPSFQRGRPENDDRVVAQAQAVQFVEHLAHLRVRVAHRRVVAVLEPPGEIGRTGPLGIPW